MTDIVIASAARTAIGSFNGAFNSVPAHDLGKVAIKGALERANVKPEEVDEVIMGQILSAGQGQNPARQAAVNAGIPVEKTALGINQLCGSGLRAVALGFQAIRGGDSKIVVAVDGSSTSDLALQEAIRVASSGGSVLALYVVDNGVMLFDARPLRTAEGGLDINRWPNLLAWSERLKAMPGFALPYDLIPKKDQEFDPV